MSIWSTKQSAIGVYDSGVGGLSILSALKRTIPDESFIYVADSGHAPYGDQSTENVIARARAVTDSLQVLKIKGLVVACNTASVVAARSLRAAYDFPIIAMEPAIKPAVLLSRSKVVLVLATSTTIRSEAVERLCRAHGDEAHIILQACPGLVERVEHGEMDDPRTRELLQKYLQAGLEAGADTIVLGCTHYAFLREQISRLAGAAVAVIEPSEAIARQMTRVLASSHAMPSTGPSTTRFYTSGEPQQLTEFLAKLGERDACVQRLPSKICGCRATNIER